MMSWHKANSLTSCSNKAGYDGAAHEWSTNTTEENVARKKNMSAVSIPFGCDCMWELQKSQEPVYSRSILGTENGS